MTSTTYKEAGVNISLGNELVDNIKHMAKNTHRSEVISGIGGFAGLFSLEKSNVQNPVLVAATDGVGTKLKIAIDANLFDHIGQDLVAMCVNDLICCGAEPLFFLDYFATGVLNKSSASTIIQSIASCLKDINCALLGGETAEMPGLYQNNDFDLAGFAVGLVDRKKIITGENVEPGDKLIGINSSGIHSNGYSLVRKIIEKNNIALNNKTPFSNLTLAEELLIPTKLYVTPVLKLLQQFTIKAMAHITGGGLIENLPRVIPDSCQISIDKNSIHTQPIFNYLKELGQVPDDEMWRVFNMGIGFVMFTKAQEEQQILTTLKDLGEQVQTIGEVLETKKTKEPRVLLQ